MIKKLIWLTCLFAFSIMASCKGQKLSKVRSENSIEESNVNNEAEDKSLTIDGIQDDLKPDVFIVSGVGYQGVNQTEINSLPEFTVNPGGNVTKKINTAIRDASKSNINGKKGGRVIINSGTYVVGKLNLRSNVHIRLKEDVLLRADQTNVSKKNMAKEVFSMGRVESIRNVSIVGEGKGDMRPKIKYVRESERKKGGSRAFAIGSITNLFIQNVLIEDDQTRFSGVAFFFKKGDTSKKGCAKNVTVDNVEQTNASYGYGLIQTNAGANMLLSNLVCSGGVTARIETDNRNTNITVGVDNIQVKNVTNSKGKAAVYLQPHNIENGKVIIDGAFSFGSQFTIEMRAGTKGDNGSFASGTSIKNVRAQYALETTVHFSGKNSIPKCLLSYFKGKEPDFDKERVGAKKGPSISAIGNYANYATIDKSTVSAFVPDNTPTDNKVSSRKLIITGNAYRGKDPEKQCGDSAY